MKERLNPENGICLSKLYDSVFDKGLIGIRTYFFLILSPKLMKNKEAEYYNKYFAFLSDFKLQLPERFKPKKEFLEYHIDTIFQS